MYQRTILPNGLRILTASMPHVQSVGVSVYIGTGSRYESAAEAGLSHFVEHLCFKGTTKRPTAKDVAETIDNIGGVLNAATDRELTVYYAKVAGYHLETGLDILSDLVRNPIFEPAEVEKERNVILEELAAVEDSPGQLVELLLDSLLWPQHPLGWDVAGSKESVASLTRDQARGYLEKQYVPNNAVVSIAGNVSHQEVVDMIWQALGSWPGGTPVRWYPVTVGHNGRLGLRYKDTEQTHLMLAVHGMAMTDPRRYSLAMLSIVMGESMSSRLFLELREKRGLVYEVHTYVTHFLDSGAFSVYAAVDPRNARDGMSVILAELAVLREGGISSEELGRAKEISKGRLLLRMEDTRAVSGWMGSQELLFGQVRTVEEVVEAVEAVTEDDVRQLARELLMPERIVSAVIGPHRSEKRFLAALGA